MCFTGLVLVTCCSKPCDARDLLPNAALREVLGKYATARPLLLAAAEATVAERPGDDSHGQQRGQTVQWQPGQKRMRQQQQDHQLQHHADKVRVEEEEEKPSARLRTHALCAAPAVQAGKQRSNQVDNGLAADTSSGWSDEIVSGPQACVEDDDQGSSSQSPRLQQRPPGRQAAQQQQQQAGQQAGRGAADTPSGFVRCPVCR